VNKVDYVSWDCETGGLDTSESEILQIGAVSYNARTLEPQGEFIIHMLPARPGKVHPKAIEVNGLTQEVLKERGAVDQKTGWLKFVDWVGQFNKTRTKFGAPIPVGKNIRDFDLEFAARYNKEFLPRKKEAVLFNQKTQINLEDYLFAWFENDPDLDSFSMDAIRPYFGMKVTEHHDALVDARQTGELVMRFIKLKRSLRAKLTKDGKHFINFKGCCA
jgi:DNA polymerase III alpha subunit (gram-positive type)